MADDKTARNVLPIPDRPRSGLITYDARDPDTKYPPINQLRPPKGAPNVLVILIDDAGFGSSSAFGGPCSTPAAERLAAAEVRECRESSPESMRRGLRGWTVHSAMSWPAQNPCL